jgi:hypothetical protein
VWSAALCALLVYGLTWSRAGRAQDNRSTQDEPTFSQPWSSRPAESFVPGRILLKFRAGTSEAHARGLLASYGARTANRIPGLDVHVVELPPTAIEEHFIQSFRGFPEVEFAELDRLVEPAQMTPNDPWYVNTEWHLRRIDAPTAWTTSTGSSSIVIAILDTGVNGNHEDLSSKMVAGWNSYDNNANASDVNGHGTLVAGTAAASSNNAMGVASVAWGCKIMPVRISAPDGTASYSSVANGLTWAANHGARVANVSYMMTESSTVSSAASFFQSKGGVVTMSAGNYGTFHSASDNPYVLTVSATDYYDVLYSWSDTGNNVDLAAPGYVYTTSMAGGYTNASGTSFSAPIVAGVAALVMSANPGLTGPQVQDIIKRAADDFGSPGWDSSYGWGRVNAARAVSAAGGGTVTPDSTPPTVGIASPAAGATVSGTVSVSVSAGDNVGVASVNLNVDGVSVGTATASPYSFSWNSTTVGDGTHTLTATARDAAGNTGTSAALTVNVNNAPPPGDTAAPTVSIASPANGATVSGVASVAVGVTDNVGVVKVDLYVDGQLTATSNTSPFTTKWNTKKATKGAHALQCRAYDAAGNAALSQTVTVYSR